MFPEWHQAVPESAYFKVPETLKTFRMYSISRYASCATRLVGDFLCARVRARVRACVYMSETASACVCTHERACVRACARMSVLACVHVYVCARWVGAAVCA